VEEDQELELPQDTDLEETTPKIYSHELDNIDTPKTLDIQGYIKNKNVIVLIYSGSTHNFINYNLESYLNFFVYPAP